MYVLELNFVQISAKGNDFTFILLLCCLNTARAFWNIFYWHFSSIPCFASPSIKHVLFLNDEVESVSSLNFIYIVFAFYVAVSFNQVYQISLVFFFILRLGIFSLPFACAKAWHPWHECNYAQSRPCRSSARTMTSASKRTTTSNWLDIVDKWAFSRTITRALFIVKDIPHEVCMQLPAKVSGPLKLTHSHCCMLHHSIGTATFMLHHSICTANADAAAQHQHCKIYAAHVSCEIHCGQSICASVLMLQLSLCSSHSAVFKPLFSFSCTSAATVIQHYLWSHIHAHNIHTATFTPQLCSSSHQQHLYHCLHAAAYMQHLHCTSHTVTFQLQHSHCCHHTPHFWCCIYACTCTH